ncbi:hypothetical protein LTR27_010700 [Elasticomyces elasticus]|nr:hypothetical protein LTR27_010700 [Elasticomyces elasticus]
MDIAGLPLDVRVAITSYIHSRKDVISLTRSCRGSYAAVTPQLYRNLSVRESMNVDHLIAMLSPENGGLQHIRHLEIEANSCGAYRTNRPSVDQILQLMANLLPRDVLLSFMLDCSTSFKSSQALQTLYRRQRFLRTTRLDSGVFTEDAVLNGSARMQNITLLQLQIHGPIATDYGHGMVAALPALLHLEIRADLLQYCVATSHNQHSAAQRIDASAEILTKIFRRGTTVDAERCEANRHDQDTFVELWNSGEFQGRAKGKLKLRSLSLHGLDLGKPEHLLQAVEFSRLHSLILQEWTNVDELLRGVRPTGLPSRMDLTDLVLTANQKWAQKNDREAGDDAIDDFLKSFHGLKRFTVCAPEEETMRPSTEAIMAHADTLRSLFLCCKYPEDADEEHFNAADLQACLKQCNELEQLAVQVPPLYLELEIETLRRVDGAFMDALGAAPSLHTLRILTGPEDIALDYEVTDSHADRVFVITGLRTYATEYFARLSKTVNVLSLGHSATGGNGDYFFGDQLLRTKFYSRGKTIDAYGKIEAIAFEMDTKQLAQDIEPISDIFDIDPYSGRMMRSGYRA